MIKSIISVVIPVYKTECYIERCLKSIIEQTYPHLDIWVVDDCSPDNSGKICDMLALEDSRIHVIHQKENGGAASARNTALDTIKSIGNSEYIAFIDSDDYIHPEYFERLLNLIIQTQSDISWVKNHNIRGTNFLLYDNNKSNIPSQSITIPTKQLLLQEDQRIMYSMLWGKLFKAHLWDNVRLPVTCTWYEDGATTFRVLYQASNITISEEKLYYYCYSENSSVRSPMNEKKCRDGLFTATEKIKFYTQQNEPDLLEMAYVGYANTILNNMLRSRQLPEKTAKYFYKEMWNLYKQVYKRLVNNHLITRKQRLKYVIYRVFPASRNLYLYLKGKINKY